MEPGGIEPPPNPTPLDSIEDLETVRATRRAVQGDPTLSKLVDSWPTLPSESRELITVILEQCLRAASLSDEDVEPSTRLSCTVDERSNAQQGVQCELGSGADESVVDCTEAARPPAGRGGAAPDGDSGEVRS